MSAIGEIAAAYASRLGWAVLPLEPSGKRPLTPRGVQDASRSPRTIESWWAKWPYANIGIACAPSRLAVLDIDPRNGGNETFAGWLAEHGPLPHTPQQETGGGGSHLVFQADQRIARCKIGPGVELITRGYFVAAPSIHPSGNAYKWMVRPSQVPVAALPEWIVARAKPEPAPIPFSAESTFRAGQGGSRLDPVSRARRWLAAKPPAVAGQGGHAQTFAAATALIHGFGLAPSVALPLLAEWNERCDPPWSRRDLEHKIDDAKTKPHRNPYGWLLNSDPKGSA